MFSFFPGVSYLEGGERRHAAEPMRHAEVCDEGGEYVQSFQTPQARELHYPRVSDVSAAHNPTHRVSRVKNKIKAPISKPNFQNPKTREGETETRRI